MQDTVATLNDLRRRVLNKEPVTNEELAAAIQMIRTDRKAASEAKAKKAEKSTVVLPDDLNDLFATPAKPTT